MYSYQTLKIDGNQTKRMNSLKKMKKRLHMKDTKGKEWILLRKWYQSIKIERNQMKRMNSLKEMTKEHFTWKKSNEKNEFS